MKHLVYVMTRSMAEMPVIAGDGKSDSKSIDWHDSSDRKWLMNHLHWAMMNGQRVMLFPSAAARRESN